MDTREKLLGSIEERLTVYANWVNQGGGIRSDGAEYLYCDLLNTAWDYELTNMNRIRDNFPAIDLGDPEERLAVQVTSTGDAAKVRKTLHRFYDHHLEGDYNRLILLIAGKADCRAAQFAHPGIGLEIWGTAELIRELRGLSVKKLREVDVLLRERVDAPEVRKPILNLPVPERRTPVGFLGRTEELVWIAEELKKGTKPVVVAGLGGVGKTALAVEFQRGWTGNVYFVRFRDSFTRTLADSVGQAIDPQERLGLNEEQTAALALEYLRRCEKKDLLILDNAEVTGKTWHDLTQDPFYEKLRRLGMAILVTTRHRDTGGRWLGRLRQEELREIFRKYEAGISEKEMDNLIDAVDGHTMTVDMIARTIRESWGTVKPAEILNAMKNSTLDQGHFDEIENDHDPEQRQIYAHLRALFDFSGIGEDGKHALRCATLLPQTGMDARLLRTALTGEAAKEIKTLEKKGWVELKNGLVTIHPVVRLVCRTELKPTEENCEEFLLGVMQQYDKKRYDHMKFRQMAELFEHAHQTLEDKDGFWAGEAGHFWSQVGEPGRALALELRAAELREQHQPDSNALATAYNNLGGTYGDLGDHKQALAYKQKALGIRERVLPEDHPDLATSYNNVGHTYDALGNHKQALAYQQKALGILERVLPENHPDLATSYNNVGYTYTNLGNHKQALAYQQKALGIWERVLPEDHPDLALSYNNVGGTYGALGDHKQALEYDLKALGIRERVLPEDHPALALSYNNLCTTYYHLGKLDKALAYQQKALGIRERVLPEDHPDLAQSYSNLSATYGNLGDHEKELEYDLKALGIRERVLPKDHPDLAQSYNNVGLAYGNLGDHKQALAYQQKALGIRERVLPDNHPLLAMSCNNIACTYYRLGRLEEAAAHMRRAADIISRSALPETHPNRVNFTKWADELEAELRWKKRRGWLGRLFGK